MKYLIWVYSRSFAVLNVDSILCFLDVIRNSNIFFIYKWKLVWISGKKIISKIRCLIFDNIK